MKILQIGKFYPIRGGVEKVMYDLTKGLSDQGMQCDMLCATTENHPGGTIVLNEYGRVLAVVTKLKFAATMIAPQMIFRLRKIAKLYDIIHIHHPDPMAALALYLSGYRGKVVLHWHSDILKQKTLLKVYKPLQNWLIHRADKIVGTTPVYVKESAFLQQVQHKVDYIPIGVEKILSQQSRVEQIKNKYAGKKIIFSLGRLVDYKGYAYLLKAAKYFPPNYQLIIGGMGPLRQELEALIATHHLQEKVELLGYVADEDVPNYFAACDLFCLSSIVKTEAFAIVQIEAMSCGNPVVSTHIPGSGVSWVNRDQISGLIVPIEDSEAMAKAIREILDNPSLYIQLADGALDRYKTNFTRDRMIEICTTLYHKLLAN